MEVAAGFNVTVSGNQGLHAGGPTGNYVAFIVTDINTFTAIDTDALGRFL